MKTWRGWVLWCLAAPLVGVLVLLTAIPAAIGMLLEMSRKDVPWNDEMHRRYPPKKPE